MKTQTLFLAIGSASVAMSIAPLRAATVFYSDTFPASGTALVNFNGSLVFPKFDAALGTLTSVQIQLDGSITASQAFENRGGSGATITMTSTGTMTLQRPDTTTLVVTVPQVQNSRGVGAYDLVLDFGGSSGVTFPDSTSSASNVQVFSGASDLALFTRGVLDNTTTIALPVTALGNSVSSGAANVTISAGMVGFAGATVFYNFTATEVPEASTYGSIGAVAIVGFLGYRRSRK
jgi:hypothetical protein